MEEEDHKEEEGSWWCLLIVHDVCGSIILFAYLLFLGCSKRSSLVA